MLESLFHITVEAGEVVLAHQDGTLVRALTPGRYRRGRRETYLPVDTTEQLTKLAVQEIPTAEGVTVKVSAAVRWLVTDAVTFATRTRSAEDILYLESQLALRTVLAELPLEQITQAPRADESLTTRARDLVNEAVSPLGIKVLAITARDVVLPPEVRKANLDLVTARVRGLAQLEAARAETAAVRSLANAARVLDASPSLAQLRLIQSAPEGAMISLTMPGPVTAGQDAAPAE